MSRCKVRTTFWFKNTKTHLSKAYRRELEQLIKINLLYFYFKCYYNNFRVIAFSFRKSILRTRNVFITIIIKVKFISKENINNNNNKVVKIIC